MKSLVQFISESQENMTMEDLINELSNLDLSKKTVRGTADFFNKVTSLYNKNFDKQLKKTDLGNLKVEETYLIYGGKKKDDSCYIIKIEKFDGEYSIQGRVLEILKNKPIKNSAYIDAPKFDTGLWTYYEIPQEISEKIFKS